MPSWSDNGNRRILVVEPLNLVRTCLTALMTEVAGPADEAETACQAFSMAVADNPRLVLFDVRAAKWDGCAVIRKFKHALPDTRVIAMLAQQSEQYADECVAAGADGCVFFTDTRDELSAMAHNLLTAPRMAALNGHARNGTGDGAPRPRPHLTVRETQVLERIAKGLSSKAIATVLNVSVATVQRHRFTLMTKLGLHNAAALTVYFLAHARDRMPITKMGNG